MLKYLRNAVVWLVSFLLAMPPQWALAADPIVVDPATSKAKVATTPSGKPMLNIVKPNAAGVSHNKFTNFNVTNQGLVVNNATGTSITSLAGAIEANPNFAGRAANLILNEVTSSNRSTLSGPTEIGGQAADYILANPNGITCDGCGFINTPRATLTTGTPVFTGSALTGLSVEGGDVAIEGLGLDASKASKFDIVTRAATINAQINAQDLGVHTGRQDFDYATRAGTAKLDDGSTKPAFAIDSTALGGMYAGRITLVGTEAGVGVRTLGDVAASASDMVITADGKLELKSNLSAANDIQLTSQGSDVVAEQTVYAGRNLSASAAAGQVKAGADGTLGAAGDVTVSAATLAADAGSRIVAGMDSDGALTTSGSLSVTATTQIATGEGFLGGGQDVTLSAPTVDLSRATDDNSETVRSRGTLTIASGNLTAANGRIASDGAMTLKGNSPIVLGAGDYVSPTTITLTGDSVTSAATIVSDDRVDVTSTVGDIVNTGSMTAGTSVALTSAADIDNAGAVSAQTGVTVTAAGTVTNQSGSSIASATDATIDAPALNNAGDVYAAGNLTVNVAAITNTGVLAGGADLTFATNSLTNDAGVLHAENNLIVGGYGGAAFAALFDNASGTVETMTGDIIIDADTIKNRKSQFSYTSGLVYDSTVASKRFNAKMLSWGPCIKATDGGTCLTYIMGRFGYYTPFGHLQFTSQKMGNSYVPNPSSGFGGGTTGKYPLYAKIYTPMQYRYYQGAVSADSPAALMTAGGNITLNATTVRNDNSTIYAAGDIDVSTTTFDNEAVVLYNDLYFGNYITSSCTETAWGAWICPSPRPLSLYQRQAVFTGKAVVQAGGNLTINASGGVRNGTELVYAAPPATAASVDSRALVPAKTSSGIIDAAAYINLIPGKDALFVVSKAPKPKFLYETRAMFVDLGRYYGSDYFLSKFGDYDPEAIPTRLGDAYFETQLVRQAVLQQTGSRWLDNTVADDIAQMKALLDSGVSAGRDLNLAFGVALTAAQIAALTSDIIWYEETVVDGRTVLAPRLYLADATRAAFDPKGAILTGHDVTVTADTIVNDHGTIAGESEVDLTAAGDITSVSGAITSDENVNLTSTGGDVIIETQVDTFVQDGGRFRRDLHVHSVQHETSTVTAGGNVSINAAGDVKVLGAKVAAGGDADLTAGGDVNIGVVTRRDATHIIGDEDNYTYDKEKRVNTGSAVTAGGNVDISAGFDASVTGSRVAAGGDLALNAVGDVTVQSAQDTFTLSEHAESSGGFGRSSSYALDVQQTKQKGSKLQAGGDVAVGALVGDLALVSSDADAGGDLTLSAANGVIYLGARKDKLFFQESYTRNGTMKFSTRDQGSVDETVVHPLLTANGNIAIVTGSGAVVDYRETGNLDQSIDQLAQAPGLAWMQDLRARDDVTWNAITEAHRQWDYKASGLSSTGSLIVSLAVAVATYGTGTGAKMFGGKLASGFGLEAATANAMANAGFGALVSQAAVAVGNNGGDILGALKDLGSIETVKALATSMLTAGLISGLNIDTALATAPAEGASELAKFADKLKIAVAQGTIGATVDSVVNGHPLTENLKSAIANAAVTAVSQQTFELVGDIAHNQLHLNNGDLEKVVMHAVAGCAMGQLGSGQCAAGAIAAGLQEVAGDAIAQIASDPGQQTKLAGLIGALAVTATGGDASAVSTAANIAETANAFNRQLHTPIEQDLNWQIAEKVAANNGTDVDTEAMILDYISCEIVQCTAGINGVQPIDPNSLEYHSKITKLFTAFPEHMAYLTAAQDSAIANGGYIPYQYTSGPVSTLNDYMTDTSRAIWDGGIDPVNLEMLTGVAGAARSGLKYGVSSLLKVARNITGPKLPTNPSQLGHIFRNATGHLDDTPANKRIIENLVASRRNKLGKPDINGNIWYAYTKQDGSQLWATVRNGVVQNAGQNAKPRIYDPVKGLVEK